MAGELVPVVMVPRFTTFAGATDFYTIAMDVTEYQTALLSLWRGPDVPAGATWSVTAQESTDQNSWSTCTGGGPTAVGASTEVQMSATLTRRWFRLKITIAGSDPVLTGWAVGFLEQRLS